MSYSEETTIKRLLQEVMDSKGILPVNKVFIIDKEKEDKVNGVRPGTRITRVYLGLRLGLFSKKPFNKLSDKDVRNFLADHKPRSKSNNKDKGKKEYGKRTLLLHKIHLKAFLKWVFKTKGKDVYPDCVEWISTSRPLDVPLSSLKPQEVLTKTDVLKLVAACNHTRDAALIHTLFETGCRDSEWRNINYSDLEINERVAKATVTGKTGRRNVYLVKSFPRLRDWLNAHPLRHKSDFPVWVSLNTFGEPKSIEASSWRKRLSRIRERAKILKPTHPHSFRHAAATSDAKNNWNEAMLRRKYGWSDTSNMPSIYIHLVNTDLEDKIMKEAGLKPKQSIEDKTLDTINCPRCEKEWSAGTKFCVCGNILDIETAIEFEQTKAKDDSTVKTMMERMMTMQQKMTDLFEELDELKKEKEVVVK